MYFHKFPTSSTKSREGNGNPLQYSCLANPMDGGAWWAAVGHLFEGNPVGEDTNEGAMTPPCIFWKHPQVPHTARQGA